MGKAKIGRAQLLRMQADLVDKEEAFVDLKAKRRVCGDCGRPIRRRNWTKNDAKIEAQISKAAHELRDVRQAAREAEGR